MESLKKEKGSLALFVTIAMLFFMAFLLVLYVATSNQEKTQLQITARIKETYEKNVNDKALEEIYNNFIGTDEEIPIYTAEQLKKVGSKEKVYISEVGKYYTFNLNSKYVLKNNIELNKGKYTVASDGTVNFNSNAEQWVPIGTSETPFSGTFDGKNYKITGLYINNSKKYQGLFAYNSGIIQNLILDDGYVRTASYTGGVVSYNNETGKIINCTNKLKIESGGGFAGISGQNSGEILNCINEGTIISLGTYDVGGICGQLTGKNAVIEGCINKAKITNKKAVGGIVGYVKNGGTIKKCYNEGTIFSDDTERSDVGGIVGLTAGTSKLLIDQCYNNGKLLGEINIGGIVGRNGNTNFVISNCYNNKNIISNKTVASSTGNYISRTGGILGYTESGLNIKQCYNIGKIEANGVEVGGILGSHKSEITVTVTNCYYLKDTATGGINGADVAGKAEVRTSAEMQNTNFVTILNNGENNWKKVLDKNNGYPVLNWQDGVPVKKSDEVQETNVIVTNVIQ